ncbi:MAG: ABC transporter permease [Chloroflexi bacterium]|nr:ABC transporter permease [Chloroflexota bacterium]MCY3583016.1 ABC transporter permease [Chloroflexota bacterium]MCY3714939.1 ABC transporter permease [Chloroflexota bacterium]MDE2651052.1 ABC transporter permease [Chloroflexota bacterium]MXX50800.1 ABC transporter permease [Chloroflexota bacterium]
MSAILRLSLRTISRRLFQSAMCVLGVALGVAVVIAIDIANESASRAFTLSSESLVGRATHQIIGGPNGFDTALYTRLRLELGIKTSAPVVSEYARVPGSDRPLRLLGIDPLAEQPFRNYLVGADEALDIFAMTSLMTEPGAVILSESLAAELGLEGGDFLQISAGGRFNAARLVGILLPDDQVSRQGLDDLVISDISTAQEMLGRHGRLSRIDLILSAEELERLPAALPIGLQLVDVKQENSLDQMIAAFELNLQAMSWLALVVGIFLIYNTISFSVVQRREVLGIMRSLGSTRPQIFRLILLEALLLGLLGTALGLALGIIFGRGALALVSQTISDLYFSVTVQRISIAPGTLLKGAVLGLAASALAAALPSWDATRTPPAGVMKRSSQELSARQRLPLITLVAALLICLGLLLLAAGESLVLSFGALMCIVVGGALFTPVTLLAASRLLDPLMRGLFGVLGGLAARAVIRSLSRTAVAVAALTIAVSVIVGISAMIGSFRLTVADWLASSLGAQVYVSPPLFASNNASVDVPLRVQAIAEAVPGVGAVSSARHVSLITPDYPDLPPINLLASDFDIAGAGRRFKWTTAPAGQHQALLDGGAIMVSEPFAYRRGIDQSNNRLSLQTERGAVSFDVFGVYYDYSTDQGTVYMARHIYDRYFDDPFLSSLAIFTQTDADVAAVIDDLRVRLAEYDLLAQDNASLRSGALEVFDRTFSITVALRLLTTLVAFIGILSALMSLQLEQAREYGVMRATGMTAPQLTRFALLQTGLMGLVAGLLALPIGLAMSLVLTHVINLRSFGWTMQFTPQPEHFAEALAVAIIAALLAGAYPAWLLGKLQPAEALRRE